jgi:hypothetical protein
MPGLNRLQLNYGARSVSKLEKKELFVAAIVIFGGGAALLLTHWYEEHAYKELTDSQRSWTDPVFISQQPKAGSSWWSFS